MKETTKQNIELRKGFWKGKALANSDYKKLAEEEIQKLEIEARNLNNPKKITNKDL